MSKIRKSRQDAQKAAFLGEFGKIGVLTWSATAAGVSRSTVYGWLRDDEVFKAAFAEAEEAAADRLEVEAVRRGHDGVEKYVISQGRIVQHEGKPLMEREYSDALLIRLLQARRRDKFGNQSSIEHSTKDDKPLVTIYLPDNGRG